MGSAVDVESESPERTVVVKVRWIVVVAFLVSVYLGCGKGNESSGAPGGVTSDSAVLSEDSDRLAEAEKSASQIEEQPALVQIFVYGLSVYNNEPALNKPQGFYFPKMDDHKVSVGRGKTDLNGTTIDWLSLGSLEGANFELKYGDWVQQNALDLSGTGRLPNNAIEASDRTWMLNSSLFPGINERFDPDSDGLWLEQSRYKLETCALAMGPNMSNICRIGLPGGRGSFQAVAASELMVLRQSIVTSASELHLATLKNRARGDTEINLFRQELVNCYPPDPENCVVHQDGTKDGTPYKYVFDLVLVHWPDPIATAANRSMESFHANKLKKFFNNTGSWKIKSPFCERAGNRWHCESGCASGPQPACWLHLMNHYGLRALSPPAFRQVVMEPQSVFDVQMCPIVEHP